MTRRRVWPLALVAVLAAWAVWSWRTDGVMSLILRSDTSGDQMVEGLRRWLQSAGPLAPILYVAAVTVEVLVAPIPGLLLYAPGGAVFGGFLGGTLALVGNVLGATLASWLAGAIGGRWLRGLDRPRVQRLADRLRHRGLLVIVLLRLNPLTSSDVVSYVAGLVGVPAWRVALGTAVGMAPLCYAQAYAAEWIFRVLAPTPLAIGLAVVCVGLACWLLFRGTLSDTRPAE